MSEIAADSVFAVTASHAYGTDRYALAVHVDCYGDIYTAEVRFPAESTSSIERSLRFKLRSRNAVRDMRRSRLRFVARATGELQTYQARVVAVLNAALRVSYEKAADAARNFAWICHLDTVESHRRITLRVHGDGTARRSNAYVVGNTLDPHYKRIDLARDIKTAEQAIVMSTTHEDAQSLRRYRDTLVTAQLVVWSITGEPLLLKKDNTPKPTMLTESDVARMARLCFDVGAAAGWTNTIIVNSLSLMLANRPRYEEIFRSVHQPKLAMSPISVTGNSRPFVFEEEFR